MKETSTRDLIHGSLKMMYRDTVEHNWEVFQNRESQR